MSRPNSILPYTGGPWQLLWADGMLMLSCLPAVIGILWPFNLRNCDIRDELYPRSWKNILTVSLHGLLILTQSSFLVSLLFCALTPMLWVGVYMGLFFLFNFCVTFVLNGRAIQLQSQVDVPDEEKHADELWIFMNGVSVGRHWLQCNIDRLSETFGRRIHGIHNPTDGIVFDLIQCMIERNFTYATQDVRDAYKLVKEALLNLKYKKIIFILHSQGCIEGGLIVDWLLDEIPHDLLRRLEIYTFGNAANHFNNPHRSVAGKIEDELAVRPPNESNQAIRYIEHYANTGDFVSCFGVLHFINERNRFMGRLFQSPQSGHLLNQHYLSQMFPLDENRKCAKTNEFMEMDVTFSRIDVTSPKDDKQCIWTKQLQENVFDTVVSGDADADVAFVGDVNSPIIRTQSMPLGEGIKVKHLSRLWKYRNGMSPKS